MKSKHPIRDFCSGIALGLIAALVLGAGTLPLSGCGDTILNIGGPTQIQNQGGGPLPSPSPGAGSSGAVASVKIGEFGEKCPSGKEPAEAIARQLRVGCTTAITCTPKDAQGKELPHETPPKLEFFGFISGTQYVKDTESDNEFNHDVYGVGPGIAIAICKVAGVSSDAWPLEVVN